MRAHREFVQPISTHGGREGKGEGRRCHKTHTELVSELAGDGAPVQGDLLVGEEASHVVRGGAVAVHVHAHKAGVLRHLRHLALLLLDHLCERTGEQKGQRCVHTNCPLPK